jgi:SAM-dependent methyltransferase
MTQRPPHPFAGDLSRLGRHYSRLIEERGDTPQGVQWSDQETQERRMAVLAEIADDLKAASVLDFGCGTGHFLSFLREHVRFSGQYVGYDLAAPMIARAREKFPEVRFAQHDVLADGLPDDFDYIIANGVFNNLVEDNWGLMTAILRCLFPHARKGLAFNALSTYVDRFDANLFYVSPERVFRFCKEQLSPQVTLRHDYLIKPRVIPFEFSIYVHASGLAPRAELCE